MPPSASQLFASLANEDEEEEDVRDMNMGGGVPDT